MCIYVYLFFWIKRLLTDVKYLGYLWLTRHGYTELRANVKVAGRPSSKLAQARLCHNYLKTNFTSGR
jgi:hypothetical protein